LPFELARTKSKSYSLMAAKGFNDVFKLFEEHLEKVNLPQVNNMNEWLYSSLVLEEQVWTSEQVTVYDKACLIPFMVEYYRQHPQTKKVTLKDEEILFKVPRYIFSI